MPDEPESADRADKDKLSPNKNGDSSSNDERSYYYDDAHGYEDFDPGDDEEENEED